MHGVVRVCSGAIAALAGLRWVNRGGRSNGLVALVAAVVHMASQKMHVSNGRKIQLGAPGDRTKDRVQTMMAQMAAEQVDREVRRQRMEKTLAGDLDDGDTNKHEPHRVLSTEAVAVSVGQRMVQPSTQQRSLRHRNAHCSSMAPIVETPGPQDEEDDEQEVNEAGGTDEDEDDEVGQDGEEPACQQLTYDVHLGETGDPPLQATGPDSDARDQC